VKLALLRSERGDEFAVGRDGAGWVTLRELGIDAPDTGTAIAALARFDAARLDAAVPMRGAALGCPIVAPSAVVGVGLNYRAHARELGATPPREPRLFPKLARALTGPYDAVRVDRGLTAKLDYEAELAVVIGPGASVFGYAVANDLTARDWQERDGEPSRSKSFEGFGPIGPWIVTGDEVPEPQALRVRAWVSGEVRQDSSTADMVFGVDTLVRHAARTTELAPGDVILTGTPPGVGHGMEPPRYLSSGDVVACEIDGVGRIENRLVFR